MPEKERWKTNGRERNGEEKYEKADREMEMEEERILTVTCYRRQTRKTE